MRFNERKVFEYDQALFSRSDSRTALQIHDEYVRRHSAIPTPRFFEVDRRNVKIDPLWHVPLNDRTQFSRIFDIPAIRYSVKNLSWGLQVHGRWASHTIRLWLSNLRLQCVDYFPEHGDYVYFQGYRYKLTSIDLEERSMWQQTNVWLGLTVTAEIVPEGDAPPIPNLSQAVPSETNNKPVLMPEIV